MKTKYILLTVAFLFSVNSMQAQSEEDGFLEGIQSSLSNMFDNTIQGTELGRLFMLFTNDISMTMKAHNEMVITAVDVLPNFVYGIFETPSDAYMYAEFDWDNKALSMHLMESEVAIIDGYSYGGTDKADLIKINEEIDHYQYTDKDGYWYVPYEVPPYRTRYIKFNARQAAQDGLELLSEINLARLADEMTSEVLEISTHVNEQFASELVNITDGLETAIQDAESLRNELRNILNEEYMDIVGFPVFIHWALIYSPDVIRANYNVTETRQDCYNIPNGCTKLTVASGKERGKYMIFDQYNRLIFIDSKKEGSVEFRYDRDLTVNLPPAVNYSDMINQAMRRN